MRQCIVRKLLTLLFPCFHGKLARTRSKDVAVISAGERIGGGDDV